MAAAVGTAGPALADVPKPSLTGSITGQADPSSRLTIRATAAEEGGFQGLHKIQVFLLLHGVALDDISYEQESDSIATSSSFPIPVGDHDSAVGPFFTISGRDVSVSGGGDRLTVTLRPLVNTAVPPGAIFSLGVVDDLYQVKRITRPVTLPRTKTGFSWGTLAAAVIGALFAGGLFGNLFSSRRRPPPKISVYASIQRRMQQERSSP